MNDEWIEDLRWEAQAKVLRDFGQSGWFRVSGSGLWLTFPGRSLLLEWPTLLKQDEIREDGPIIPLSEVGEFFLGYEDRTIYWQRTIAEGRRSLRLATDRAYHWAARADGRQLAIHNSHRDRVEVFELPSAPSWLRSCLPLRLAPSAHWPGGSQILTYHPVTGEVVYNGPKRGGESLLWRNGKMALNLKGLNLSGSGCTGHRSQAFSPDGNWLALAAASGLILARAGADGTFPVAFHRCYELASRPLSLDWCCSEETDWLACVQPAAVRFFSCDQEGQLRLLAEWGQRVFCMQFLPSAKAPALLAMDWDGKLWLVQLRRLSTILPTVELETRHQYFWSPPAVQQEWMDSDNAEFRSCLQETRVESVAIAAETVVASNLVDQAACFSLVGGKPWAVVQVPSFSERFDFQQIAVSPSAQRLAIGRRFQIRLWKLDNDQWVSDCRALGSYSSYYGDSMWALGFLDENQVVALCSDGIRRYFYPDEEHVRSRDDELPSFLEAAALDGNRAVLYQQENYFRVDLLPQSVRILDHWTGKRPECLSISPGGTVAWSIGSRLYLRTEGQSRELEGLPIGSGPMGLGFLREPFLFLTREERCLILDWQSLERWRVRVHGPVLAGPGSRLYCRTRYGFAEMDYLAGLGRQSR